MLSNLKKDELLSLVKDIIINFDLIDYPNIDTLFSPEEIISIKEELELYDDFSLMVNVEPLSDIEAVSLEEVTNDENWEVTVKYKGIDIPVCYSISER